MSDYVTLRLRYDQRDSLIDCLKFLTDQQRQRMPGHCTYSIDQLSVKIAHSKLCEILHAITPKDVNAA